MNTKQNKKDEDIYEIDLKEILVILWKRKIGIISITLVIAILAGLFSIFAISPVYNSKLNIVINMPDIYKTKYGDYNLPITTNQQYISLITSDDVLTKTLIDMGYDLEGKTINYLRDSITISAALVEATEKKNSFTVVVGADNSAEAKILAQTLYDNYIEFIDIMIVEGELNYYEKLFLTGIDSKKVILESSQNILQRNEELLSNTPQTIDQKNAMEQIKDQEDTINYIVLEDIINPNYTDIEADIIDTKQIIYAAEDDIQTYENNLEELSAMKNDIVTYRETGEFDKLQSNIVNLFQTNIYLPSKPTESNNKTSPNNKRNVLLGGILGGMIGVLFTLIKDYWFKKD